MIEKVVEYQNGKKHVYYNIIHCSKSGYIGKPINLKPLTMKQAISMHRAIQMKKNTKKVN